MAIDYYPATGSVPVTFAIEDYTGRFPQENTVLLVQRQLNGSYQTVLGDFFGSTGRFPATLAYDERHRLVLLNVETGEERALGTFTPQVSSGEQVTVSPSGDVVIEEAPAIVSFLSTSRLPATVAVPFNASIREGSSGIQSWNLTVTANSSTLFTTSGTGEGSPSTQLDLSGLAGERMTANLTYTLNDGTAVSRTKTYIIEEDFGNDNALIPSIRSVLGLVPSENQDSFGAFLAMLITIIGTAGIVWAFPMSPEFVGVTAWLWLAFFAVLGFVSYDMLFVAGVAAASFAYLRRVR